MRKTYELTIYIAGIGTQRVGGETSTAGHIWYGLSTSSGESHSYGFAPKDDKGLNPMPVEGRVFDDDTSTYIVPAYSRTFRVTEAEYNALKDFGNDPFSNGFDGNYWAPTNSCIDFVWAALNHAGLNTSGHQGGLIPDGWFGNRDNIDKYMQLPVGEQIANKQIIDEFLSIQMPFSTQLESQNDALLNDLQTLFAQAKQATSPIILDLDGDGVETTALVQGAYGGVNFDLDAQGLAEQTGWVGADDGLLVRDLDGDGEIASGRELFGNHTMLSNGQVAANGDIFDAGIKRQLSKRNLKIAA